jgi:hypothetical protein
MNQFGSAEKGNTMPQQTAAQIVREEFGIRQPSEQAQAQLAEARKAAHDALTAAERAWYAYAGLCDVGPDRTRAFEVYENVRHARRV